MRYPVDGLYEEAQYQALVAQDHSKNGHALRARLYMWNSRRLLNKLASRLAYHKNMFHTNDY